MPWPLLITTLNSHAIPKYANNEAEAHCLGSDSTSYTKLLKASEVSCVCVNVTYFEVNLETSSAILNHW